MKVPDCVSGIFIGWLAKQASNLGSKARSKRRSLFRACDEGASSVSEISPVRSPLSFDSVQEVDQFVGGKLGFH
jgi:hypothetical protein